MEGFKMIRQYTAQKQCDDLLRLHGYEIDRPSEEMGPDSSAKKFVSLYSKGWKTTFTKASDWLARCYHDEKRVVINLHHLNTCSEIDLTQTILHEIAHALVGPGHGHTQVWIDKAKSIGLSNPQPCGPKLKIDVGRAIQASETLPKRTFHRIDIKCPTCDKKAIEKSSIVMNGIKWTLLECSHLVKHEQLQSQKVDYKSWTNISGSKTIFPYQAEGIEFLEQASGRGLIADEPGLGKTIQALGFAYFHANECTPVLWVCKATLKIQALKEALDWCGPAFMAQIIENPRSFILPGLKMYIISMDLLRNMPSEKIEKIGFKTVVADEIQHFKNPDSSRTAELRKLVTSAEYFIPLSGTPWKNRGQEYFPVLNMLDAVRFPSQEKFKNDWVDYEYDNKKGKYVQRGIKNIKEFRNYTKDIVLRRLRDDVLPDLPKINRQIRFIDMEALYKQAYDKAEEKVANIVKAAMIDGQPLANIAGMIMQLKHITGLAKVQVCIDDVQEFIDNTPESEKLTIFHHHIDVGDNLQQGDGHTYEGLDKYLESQGLSKTLRLFGGKGPEERDRIIQKFKNDSQCRILVASTLASGEGLNIQFCQNAIMLERQWNPGNEEQAELRFSRPLTWEDYPPYLQEHLFKEDHSPKQPSIRVPYMIADGTVDSILTEIVERKRLAFKKTMNDKDAELTWEENDIIREVAEYLVKKRYKNQLVGA